jgi:hypothetical protein
LGVLAMSCINEMLAKECVPKDSEEILLLIFKLDFIQSFFFLYPQIITQQNKTTNQKIINK